MRNTSYMSVLLYLHLKNDVFLISLLLPLYQGSTLSLPNVVTSLVNFLTACKRVRRIEEVRFKKTKPKVLSWYRKTALWWNMLQNLSENLAMKKIYLWGVGDWAAVLRPSLLKCFQIFCNFFSVRAVSARVLGLTNYVCHLSLSFTLIWVETSFFLIQLWWLRGRASTWHSVESRSLLPRWIESRLGYVYGTVAIIINNSLKWTRYF